MSAPPPQHKYHQQHHQPQQQDISSAAAALPDHLTWTPAHEARLVLVQRQLRIAQAKWSEEQDLWIDEVGGRFFFSRLGLGCFGGLLRVR